MILGVPLFLETLILCHSILYVFLLFEHTNFLHFLLLFITHLFAQRVYISFQRMLCVQETFGFSKALNLVGAVVKAFASFLTAGRMGQDGRMGHGTCTE